MAFRLAWDRVSDVRLYLPESERERSTLRSQRGVAQEAAGTSLRDGGGDVLPGFVDVLLQLIQRCDAQLPLDVHQLSLFGCQDLGQGLDFILNLDGRTDGHTHTHVL